MVNTSSAKFTRLGHRHRSIIRYVLFLGIFVVLAFTAWHLYKGAQTTALGQVNVVIDGDPVVIASWQKPTNNLIVVSLPSSLSVDAVHGLGSYPLRSLWKLGEIQAEGGNILSQSIEELTAVPIRWYIQGGTDSSGDGILRLRDVFSLRNVPSVLAGSIKTNMPIGTFISLAWSVSVISSDRVGEIFVPLSSQVTEDLPDGSKITRLTPQSVELLLRDEFEVDSIRKEKLTIAIYNTTQTPGLGERVAQRVTRLGGNVVRVGNAQSVGDRCQVRGSEEELRTKTSTIIAGLLDCDLIAGEPDGYTDIGLFVGEDFEARYKPQIN